MINRTKSIIFWLVLCLLTSGVTVVSQGSQVTVSLSVRGELLLEYNDKRSIVLVDTFGGNVQTLVDGGPWLESPIFAPSGDQIAYYSDLISQRTKQNLILNLTTGEEQILNELDNQEVFTRPIRWSQLNQDQILYSIYDVLDLDRHSFEIFNLSTRQITQVGEFQVFDVWNGFTMPLNVSDIAVYHMYRIVPNPVYDSWVALGVEVIDTAIVPNPRSYPGDYPVEAIIHDVILWNYETQQMISIGAVQNTEVDISSTVAWSVDGTQIMVTNKFDQRTYFKTQYTFTETNAGWTLTPGKAAPINGVPLIWLGVEDLLIASMRDEDPDIVYSLGQIVNDEWHYTEFLRFPKQDFPTDIIRISDWRLLATETEKAELSCLFDPTLPAQLTLNISGRVVDSSTRSLRSAPGIDSAVVVEMAAGTTFEVISDPWCAGGYRWWQLRLEDGTVGYAAEADTDQYWLEP